MKRIDLYITDIQWEKLSNLSNSDISKSLIVRKSLDMFFNSDKFNELIKALKEDT